MSNTSQAFPDARTLLLLLLAGISFLSANPGIAAAAPVNDDFADRLPIQLGIGDTRSNSGATIEAQERLTANDPAGMGCDLQGNTAEGGIQMYGTLWWEFTGNGGPVTVSALHSNFDTVLAVYETEGKQLLKCNDDIQPRDPTREELESRLSSEVRIQTVAGRSYAVQVGGCFPQEACYKTTAGSITLRVSPPPANDDRASAMPIAAGAPVTVTNTGATEEPSETLSCADHLYGKTVWFKYTAPAVGTAAFSAAGFDTVLAVYRGNSITPLGCNDDAIDGQTGGSRIPTIQPAGAPIEVTPGDYLIQVGGYYDEGFDIVAARNGPFAVQVEFNPDTDLDNDGVNSALDCDEANPSVRPGASEIENNDVDEDCNGEKAFDQDADGFRRGIDCRDDVAAINPGAREIRGNRIDENCDTRTPDLRPLGAKVVLEARQFDGKDPHTWVRAFNISDIPAGTQVKIRCRGDGCPFKKRRHVVKQSRGTLVLPAGFRVEVGTLLSVVMTRPETIGLRQDFRIRRAKRPVPTSHCLDPRGHRRPCRRL